MADEGGRVRRVDGFEVVSGVAIPRKRSSGQTSEGTKYPWSALGHLDHIRIPDDGSLSTSIRAAAKTWLRRNRPGWEYAARKRGDELWVWFIDPRQEQQEDKSDG